MLDWINTLSSLILPSGFSSQVYRPGFDTAALHSSQQQSPLPPFPHLPTDKTHFPLTVQCLTDTTPRALLRLSKFHRKTCPLEAAWVWLLDPDRLICSHTCQFLQKPHFHHRIKGRKSWLKNPHRAQKHTRVKETYFYKSPCYFSLTSPFFFTDFH